MTHNESALALQVLQLQEENKLLIKENAVLRSSLAILGGANFDASFLPKADSSSIPSRQDSIEELMINAMGMMVQITEKLAQNEEGKQGVALDMTEEESFDDSLKHVFVDSNHILCECIINPEGFWGKNAFNASHPMGWLLNKFPIKDKDKGLDWFPLHWCAMSNSCELIDINTLNQHYSTDAKLRLKLNEEMSPLTMAVSKPAPNLEIVSALVDMDPMVVRAKSGVDGSLPLMHALANNDDIASIKLLYDVYPDALKEQDKHGRRPISYACRHGSDEAVKLLLSVDSKSASYSSSSTGNTALHDVAFNTTRRDHKGTGTGTAFGGASGLDDGADEEGGLSIDTIMELFHANTAAIKLPNKDGALPLHIAAAHGTLTVVQLMHGLYPYAVSVADNHGMFPLDHAATRDGNQDDKQLGEAVVQYLMKARGAGSPK